MARALSVFIVLSAAMLFAATAYAISIGSYAKSTHAKIESNEAATFGMLFWNSGEKSERMVIEVLERPENFSVFIEPSEFALDKNTGSEVIDIDGRRVSAMPVYMRVVPSEQATGRYNIALSAKATAERSEGVSVEPRQVIRFIIDVGNFAEERQPAQDERKDGGEEIIVNEEKSSYAIYLLAMLILAISVAVYKLA